MVTRIAPICKVCRGIIEVPPVACLLMRRAGVHRPAEDLLDAAGKRWRQTPGSRVALATTWVPAACSAAIAAWDVAKRGKSSNKSALRRRRSLSAKTGCASAEVVACDGSMQAPVGVGEVATSTVSPVPPEAAAPADDAVGAEVEMVASSAARASQESDAMTTAKRCGSSTILRRISAIAGACSNALHSNASKKIRNVG